MHLRKRDKREIWERQRLSLNSQTPEWAVRELGREVCIHKESGNTVINLPSFKPRDRPLSSSHPLNSRQSLGGVSTPAQGHMRPPNQSSPRLARRLSTPYAPRDRARISPQSRPSSESTNTTFTWTTSRISQLATVERGSTGPTGHLGQQTQSPPPTQRTEQTRSTQWPPSPPQARQAEHPGRSPKTQDLGRESRGPSLILDGVEETERDEDSDHNWEEEDEMEDQRQGLEEEARIETLTRTVRVEERIRTPRDHTAFRPRRRWTTQELNRLLELFKRFGPQWEAIRAADRKHVDGPRIHPSRTGVNLKDKIRNHKIGLRKYVSSPIECNL